MAFSQVFDLLVKKFVKNVHSDIDFFLHNYLFLFDFYLTMKSHNYSVGQKLFDAWFNRLFIGFFPLKVRLIIYLLY